MTPCRASSIYDDAPLFTLPSLPDASVLILSHCVHLIPLPSAHDSSATPHIPAFGPRIPSFMLHPPTPIAGLHPHPQRTFHLSLSPSIFLLPCLLRYSRSHRHSSLKGRSCIRVAYDILAILVRASQSTCINSTGFSLVSLSPKHGLHSSPHIIPFIFRIFIVHCSFASARI